MFLCDFAWLLAIKHPKPHQSELPSIKCTVFAKQTMAACRFILSPPYFDTSTSELSVDSPVLNLGIVCRLALTISQFECPNQSHCKICLLCRLFFNWSCFLLNIVMSTVSHDMKFMKMHQFAFVQKPMSNALSLTP